MIIKKFLGKTEEEAVEAAKKELGPGVVIMNVKSVKRKGLFGSLRSKLIEVTVALEEESDTLSKVRKENNAPRKEKITATANKINEASKTIDQESLEKRLDSLQALLEQQLRNSQAKEEEKKAENGDNGDNDRKEDASADTGNKEENQEQDRFIRLLYNKMIDNEVDEKYANQMLEEIEKSKKPNTPIDYILANVYQKMILKFGKSEGITPSEEKPKVVAFIGPTGVGKTTTIAKVASSYVVDEKKKVALLTSDTYRIAAAEQLRTYANILEVPFRVIYTEDELRNAIMEFKEYDYIFLDTSGHSHQNEEQLNQTATFLTVIDELAERETFLVLSATTKYSDLLKISKKYKNISDFQLIFTKLDETNSIGNLLNIKLYADAPIAYITNGQNVPDDIERFDPQKAVKQLLGGGNQ